MTRLISSGPMAAVPAVSLTGAGSAALGLRRLRRLRQRRQADRRQLLVERGERFVGDVDARIARPGRALGDDHGGITLRADLLDDGAQARVDLDVDVGADRFDLLPAALDLLRGLAALGLERADARLERRVRLLAGERVDRGL